MRVAITGGFGFVGRHLAEVLRQAGHEVVLVTRPGRQRDVAEGLRGLAVVEAGLDDLAALRRAFSECQAVAHCAGINRQLGDSTWRKVHVEGTANVVEAARQAGVGKVALMSFLRARPGTGSGYHESKWRAEEIVRDSGLDYTILKCGVIYGRGDHMLDHLSRALFTFPVFGLVGLREREVRPVAVADVARVLMASLTQGRLSRQTVAVMGPESMPLAEAVRRVAAVVRRRPRYVRLPVWFHVGFAWLMERTMRVPLVSLAQVRILSEGIVEASGACDALPDELQPRLGMTVERIAEGLPEPGEFTWRDCRWGSTCCVSGLRALRGGRGW